MITREDLHRWNSTVEPRLMNQAVIDASEKIRDVGFKMDSGISYRELIHAVRGLAERMPSSIMMGRTDGFRSLLFTASLEIFDYSTMAEHIEDFEDMFTQSVGDLRQQRDTRRCDASALPRLCSALARNIHVMNPQSYKRFLEESVSYTIQHRQHAAEKVGTNLFFGAGSVLSDYATEFNDMVLFSLLKHGVGKNISSDMSGVPGDLELALETAKVFSKIDHAGIKMQAWQLDRLLMVQVCERLVLAHGASSDPTDLDDLAEGVRAINNVFSREVGAQPLMSGNCFRPCLHPKDWKVWMEAVPMEVLTRHLILSLRSMGHSECPVMKESIGRLRLQLLIDGTLCAKSMAPKGGKQSKDRREATNAIGNFVRELITDCEEPLSRNGALNGLNHEIKAVLVGLLPIGPVRKDLMRADRRVKSQVLMDDLGM